MSHLFNFVCIKEEILQIFPDGEISVRVKDVDLHAIAYVVLGLSSSCSYIRILCIDTEDDSHERAGVH